MNILTKTLLYIEFLNSQIQNIRMHGRMYLRVKYIVLYNMDLKAYMIFICILMEHKSKLKKKTSFVKFHSLKNPISTYMKSNQIVISPVYFCSSAFLYHPKIISKLQIKFDSLKK